LAFIQRENKGLAVFYLEAGGIHRIQTQALGWSLVRGRIGVGFYLDLDQSSVRPAADFKKIKYTSHA